jgi:glutamate racemase
MNNKPVLFIDSGIGGIPYCSEFVRENPHESVYYLADRKNFPYGPLKKEDLISILITLVGKLLEKINPKIIVLACNTATIAAISSLREKFPGVPFVGTVPAVKPAAEACNNGKVGVLATKRTIEDLNGLHLADQSCTIYGVAAPELVEFVEKHLDGSGEKEKTKVVKKYIDMFIAAKADAIVLGCTHFLFLLEEFHREAEGHFKVFDSLAGITKRIEFLLDENDGALRADKNSKSDYLLLLTGTDSPSPAWEKRAENTGFKINHSIDI